MHYVSGRRSHEVGAVVLLPLREKVAGEAGLMRGAKTRDEWLKTWLTGNTGRHPSSAPSGGLLPQEEKGR